MSREASILGWLLNNPPNDQPVQSNLGIDVIDVDALPDNIPFTQADNNNETRETNNEEVALVTVTTAEVRNEEPSSQQEPIVLDTGNEGGMETPSSGEWSLWSPGREDLDETHTSSVSMSAIIYANRENRLDRRESEVKRQEEILKQRERNIEQRERDIDQRGNHGADKKLKKKIDEWLAKPRFVRDPFIDYEIVGFAMSQHPYLVLSSEERCRINSTRLELEEMQEIIRRKKNKEICCPICFDSIRTPRPFMVLECGHLHCYDCIQGMDMAAGPEANPKCSECSQEIRMKHLRRIFFASRE